MLSSADEVSGVLGFLVETDLDPIRVIDDVIIRQNVSVRADDDSGTDADDLLFVVSASHRGLRRARGKRSAHRAGREFCTLLRQR